MTNQKKLCNRENKTRGKDRRKGIMNYKKNVLLLQLFSDGGASSAGGDGTASGVSGESSSSPLPEGNSVVGNSNAEGSANTEAVRVNQPAADKQETFESLLKNPAYKKEYDGRVKQAVMDRVKNLKDYEKIIQKLEPALDAWGNRYAIDRNSDSFYDDIVSAVQQDESLYEEEAIEKNMPVSELIRVKQMERENKILRQKIEDEEREQQIRDQFNTLVEASKETKRLFPEFDFDTEMQNPGWARLVSYGVDPTTAYKVVHMNEIESQIVRHSVEQTKTAISKNLQSNASRPSENGTKSRPASVTKTNPKQFTSQDFARIRAAVARGEKIVF